MNNRGYVYARAEEGYRDGYRIVSEEGANVSCCAGNSFQWKSFSGDSRISKAVHAGKEVWFRCWESDGCSTDLERVAPSKVPDWVRDQE